MEMTKVMSQLIESYKRELVGIRQELDLLWLEYPNDMTVASLVRRVNDLIEKM